MTQTGSSVTPFANPLFFDKIAAELNTKLNDLGYIDDLYGVTWIGFDGEESMPEIYVNDGSKKNLRVMPDSTKSISFFIVTGEMIEIDEIGFQIPMGLIVWMDLTKTFPAKNYDATTEVIKDVYNILNKYGCADITVNVNDVFQEFSQLSKDVAANTMRPYSGIRFEFTKNIQVCEW